MATPILTNARLRTLLSYDVDTGVFTWRATRRNCKQGAVAGTLDAKGYRRISVDSKVYLAHRLAWFYKTGHWPVCELDHINRQRDDNRISNLREANRTINTQNTNLRKDNPTGYRGVGWHKASNKWRARIQVNGKMLELGYFDDVEAASTAYQKAANIHHTARTL